MTTTDHNPYPVDSTYHPCCNAIGRHTRECPALDKLPAPSGVTKLHKWCDPEVAGELYRAFSGSSWVVERNDRRDDVQVSISGAQYPDGRIERDIFVDNADANGLTAAQARQLCRHLIAAADEVEQMAGYDAIEATR